MNQFYSTSDHGQTLCPFTDAGILFWFGWSDVWLLHTCTQTFLTAIADRYPTHEDLLRKLFWAAMGRAAYRLYVDQLLGLVWRPVLAVMKAIRQAVQSLQK